jgi:hypothetical protein
VEGEIDMRLTKLAGAGLKLLATGSLSLFMAACYGAPMGWKQLSITVRDPEGAGIPDLSVALREAGTEKDSTVTDASGTAWFMERESCAGMEARITDQDGAANGGSFARKDIDLGDEEAYDVTLSRG